MKCILLSFYSKSSISQQALSSHYQINDHVVTPQSHALSWSRHLSLITSQAYNKLGLLRRTFSSVTSVSAKNHLFLSLIRSQLVYCSQVWRPHQLKDIKLIEDVQRRTTKFILNDYASDYKSRLSTLKLLYTTLNDL